MSTSKMDWCIGVEISELFMEAARPSHQIETANISQMEWPPIISSFIRYSLIAVTSLKKKVT